MKYKESRCDFIEERDAELLRACTNIIGGRDKISLSEVYDTLAQTPCSRFYVSEERAYIVIGYMQRGISLDHMVPLRREMFQEIFRRYNHFRRTHPSLTKMECIWHVCHQPAPKFYLTPGSIRAILSKVRKEAKKRCYEERKRKLRFMLGTL